MKVLTVLFLFVYSHFVFARSIYGPDDRVEPYESNDMSLVKASRAVAIMAKNEEILPQDEDGILFHIEGFRLGNDQVRVDFNGKAPICEDVAFSDQIVIGSCSGFLIGEDLLLTAGHCVFDERDCSETSWIFNYNQQNSDQGSSLYGRAFIEQIYRCEEVIASESSLFGEVDYSILRLERKVPRSVASPLKWRQEGEVEEGMSVAVVGYPLGIPMKIASNAVIMDILDETAFFANLDSFTGNSGSPVFNLETGLVEGILVSGNFDWELDKERGCAVNVNYGLDPIVTERVFRVTQIPELRDL